MKETAIRSSTEKQHVPPRCGFERIKHVLRKCMEVFRIPGPENTTTDLENGMQYTQAFQGNTKINLNPLQKAREDYLLTVTAGSSFFEASENEALVSWPLKQLEGDFLQIPQKFAQFVGKSNDSPVRVESLTRFYAISTCIAGMLFSEQHVQLDQILDELRVQDLIWFEDNSHNEARQLIFILLGIITKLFEPDFQPKEGHFAMSLPISGGHRSRQLRSFLWKTPIVPLEADRGSVADLLKHFSRGDSPISRMHIPKSSSEQPSFGVADSTTLKGANLTYHTLHQLVGITISWVDSLCMHLTFDRKTKSLRLFRYPSFCAMLLSGSDSNQTFLCRIFQSYLDEQIRLTRTDSELSPPIKLESGDYFRELIFSYRLIFGQDHKSWSKAKSTIPDTLSDIRQKDFKDTSPKARKWSWQQGWNLRRLFTRQHTSAVIEQSSQVADPLIARLCFQDWGEEPLYDQLDAPNLRISYSAATDFPYFGNRLIELQEYVLTECPDDWRMLWYDRRDKYRFWVLWVAIILGLVTILLAVIQVVLACLQVWTPG